MIDKIKKFFKKYFDKTLIIITSILSAALSISLIIQVCRLYFEHIDETPIYTRELATNYLAQISSIIILWLVIVIISGVYFIINKKKDKNTSKLRNITKLKRMELTLPAQSSDDSSILEYDLLNKEKKYRLICLIANCVILTLCIVMSSCYLFNSNNFKIDDDVSIVTHQIIELVIHVLPWAIIALISSIGCTIFNDISAKRSIEYIKIINKGKGKAKITINGEKPYKKYIILGLQIALVITSIVLIIIGSFNGGSDSVLLKAANICSECIGLG